MTPAPTDWLVRLRRWCWQLPLLAAGLLAGCAAPPSGKQPSPAPAIVTHKSYAPPPFVPQGPLSAVETGELKSDQITSLTAPSNIWERIRRRFAMPDLDTELVHNREQWYASRPDYIQRMTLRSQMYLFHIVEEIERRELPMELALLPFIESAFNPQAVSSARAAGMWQFMPATGQSFDLKQNMFRDDRRDVLASTRAALDYLEQLYARFGDWHLALAAYNWGQGNVGRAITRNQSLGLGTGYLDLNMPQETRYYVPKLQAVKNIVANPEAFGLQLPDIGNHPFFDTITITRDIDVAMIARLAEVDEKDFRALNPSIKLPVVMAAGTPNVLLPWDNAALFEARLKNQQGPLASWTAWVVPTTMSAADAARRVGMSEIELRRLNNIPPRMRVRAGSSLLVPRTGAYDRDVPEHVADNGQLRLQPDAPVKPRHVIVRKGDSLSTIAQRHGVSLANLAKWNGLTTKSGVRIGQQLALAQPARATSSARAGTGKKAAATTTRTAAKKPARSTAKKSATKTRVASKK